MLSFTVLANPVILSTNIQKNLLGLHTQMDKQIV